MIDEVNAMDIGLKRINISISIDVELNTGACNQEFIPA
jgi:hypothetical protein